MVRSSAAGRTGNAGQYQTDRGPFTNENITHDVLANLTKVWGSHAVEVRLLLPEQLQAAEHLRELQQPDQLHRRREQPVRYGLQLRERGDRRVQQLHAGQQVRDSGVALQEHRVVRAGQLEAQPAADARLRRALLLPDAAVGPHAAGLELPAGPVQRQQRRAAVPPGLHRRLSVLGHRPARHGSALVAAGRRRRRWPTPSRIASSAVSCPAPNRFNGAFQAGQGINDQLQDGNAFRISPRFGFTYDLTGKQRDDRPRRLGHLLRPAAGQPGLRHDRQRARAC